MQHRAITHSPSQLCDESLVDLVLSGQQGAFDELIQRHRRTCFGMALTMVRNSEDAEDIVQNAFWKAFLGLDQFENRARFTHWLYRIVRNECLMTIRGRRRHRFEGTDDLQIDPKCARPGPERAYLQDEAEQVLLQAVGGLPWRFRDPVRMSLLEDVPVPEVARRLGVTVPATKSRLSRGRRMLKDRLSSYCAA